MATETDEAAVNAEKQQATKRKQLLAHLQSGDEAKALGALKELRVYGNDASVAPLIAALVSTKSEKVYEASKRVLHELKTPNAVPPLVAALRDDATKGHRHVLVATFWEAGLDATPHIDLLVDLAISEDFETCLECLTVIENLGNGFPEEQIFPLIAQVKGVFGTDPQKELLYASLAQVLQDLVIG